nr:Formin-like protein [Ipomoea batatas]
MADSDEGREDTICEVVTESSLDSVFELKRIKCTPSICDASPTDTDRSLVAIRDYAPDDSPRTSLVFPPANHENLPVSVNLIGDFSRQHHLKSSFSWEFPSSPSESMSSSSQSRFVAENDDSSSSFSPSGSDSGDPSNPPPWTQHPPPKTVAGSARWWNFGIEFLHSKFNGIVKHLLSFTSVPGAISPSYSPVGRATLAAAVLMFIYFWRRRRRRRRLEINRESREQLIRTVKEKDKRINQLLEQIAEMNKLLVALQKGHQSNPS